MNQDFGRPLKKFDRSIIKSGAGTGQEI